MPGGAALFGGFFAGFAVEHRWFLHSTESMQL
jgi:hypothetical protein